MKRESHPRVKVFAGMISSDLGSFKEASLRLSKRLGPVDLKSPIYEFNHTPYYNEELGKDLKRQFISFQKPFSIDSVYTLKLLGQKIEKELSDNNRRRINLDPGYLTLAKVVLLTTKDFVHRISLRQGIFAEVTLCYKKDSYGPWEWTYPDYKTQPYLDFFNSAREIYRKTL